MSAFPLKVKLDTITLAGFGTAASDNSQSIPGYDGGPLYCHTDEVPVGSRKIAITIDEVAPSSFTTTKGDVTSVTASYQDVNGNAKTIMWSTIPAGVKYDGLPLLHNLVMAPDLSTATIKITQPSVGTSTANSVGLVVLGKAVTGGAPLGFFVSVPLGTSNATTFTSMDIHWVKNGGSMAGPIGSGVIPSGGP